jgi:L-threonylcarbamoyladenylate synthase
VRTDVLAVDPIAPSPEVLQHAAAVIGAGGVVAVPTETFYGLAVHALDAVLVRRLFTLKGRPESRPILVLVDDPSRVGAIAEVNDLARALMTRHWPGPLTLVLKARHIVPTEVTAGTGTIGVRQPGYPIARALAAAVGAPITAPSANPTGDDPPTTAEGVLAAFDGHIDLVLDGGETPGGPPSTVLDVSVDPPRLVRDGAVKVML